MAYSIQVEKMTDEEREKFDGDIGMTSNAEDSAKVALRAHQKAAGIHFDNPDAPVTVEPGMQDEDYG